MYRKLTGKEVERERASGGILGGLSPQTRDKEQNLQLTRSIANESIQQGVYEDIQEKKADKEPEVDSWKDRIKK